MKILYGIQPTGKIHLGNYLGGLKLAIEKNAEILIAQYHSYTTIQNKKIIIKNIENIVIFLGGFDIIPVLQKHKHIKLAWEIQCITPVSELLKMTQWKDKKEGNAGLLTYPCLMAADIIISNPDYVIIGEDQIQHMEFYRRICKRLGIKRIAKNILTETPRIMSIKDPTKKMSKSLGDEHCIYLGEDNTKKIMKAPTTEEGIINLEKISKGLGIKFDRKDCKQSKINIINKLAEINNF
jgi:tryptophanyl-tRNA synthetase